MSLERRPGRNPAARRPRSPIMLRLPASALILAPLLGGCSESAASPQAAPAAQTPAPQTPAPQNELAELRAKLAVAQARIVELQGELADERAARVQREQEWLQFTRGISELSRSAGVKVPEFPSTLADPHAAPAAPTAPDPLLAERAARGRKLFTKLRALFTADEVAGLDLLEAGEFRDGAIGPVVLRMLDADGRPYGTLCAEQLHFEASVSARTLTLVLERGYERRGDQRYPFAEAGLPAPAPVAERSASDDHAVRHGTKRIALPEIDPTRWIESVPELFGPAAKGAPLDDGKHDLTAIRVALNQLLREDSSGGWWRLSGLEGVQQDVLREVVLDGFGREGNQERRLFADRLTVLEEARGVQLLLEGGAQVRGDEKVPFLGERYRIYLPQAEVAAWIKSGVPVVRAPESKPPPAPVPHKQD